MERRMGKGRGISEWRLRSQRILIAVVILSIREDPWSGFSRYLKDRGWENEEGGFFCKNVDAAPTGHFCEWRPPYLIFDVTRNVLRFAFLLFSVSFSFLFIILSCFISSFHLEFSVFYV